MKKISKNQYFFLFSNFAGLIHVASTNFFSFHVILFAHKSSQATETVDLTFVLSTETLISHDFLSLNHSFLYLVNL